MAGKEISLTGELHMSSTGSHMTVDAVEALKVIGLAYGLYDHAEEFRGLRVSLQDGARPALVVQQDSAGNIVVGFQLVPIPPTGMDTGSTEVILASV